MTGFADKTIVAYVLIPSESDDDKTYFVAKHKGGRITCNCEHYRRRLKRRGRLCKHGAKANNENLFELTP